MLQKREHVNAQPRTPIADDDNDLYSSCKASFMVGK